MKEFTWVQFGDTWVPQSGGHTVKVEALRNGKYSLYAYGSGLRDLFDTRDEALAEGEATYRRHYGHRKNPNGDSIMDEPKVKHHRRPNQRAKFIGSYIKARHPSNLAEGQKYFQEAAEAWNRLQVYQRQNPVAFLEPLLAGAAGGVGAAIAGNTINKHKNPRFTEGELVRVRGLGDFSPGANAAVVIAQESGSGGLFGSAARYRVQLPNGQKLVVAESAMQTVKNPVKAGIRWAVQRMTGRGFLVQKQGDEYIVAKPGARRGLIMSAGELVKKVAGK